MYRLFCCCIPNNPQSGVINNDNSFEINSIVDVDRIPRFSFNGMVFQAIPCEIYDGDTLSFVFRYNNEVVKWRCRCLGYDSPEMKPSKSAPNRAQEIAAAKLAKDRFAELLTERTHVYIKCHGFDKYGRVLVEIYKTNNTDNSTTTSINQVMMNEHHGVPYTGGTKTAFVSKTK